jgi:glutamate-ammonia-ligase adenylyltransferase
MSLPEFSQVMFADTPRAERSVTALYEQMLAAGSRSTPADFTRMLAQHLLSAPDPDLALTGLLRFVEASLSRSGLFNDLMDHPVLLDMLMRVMGDSAFLTDILVREPGLFRWLTASGVLHQPLLESEIREELGRLADAFPRPERYLDAVRRLLRREVLRVGVQDLLGLADLRRITAQLSLIADVVIDAVLAASIVQLKQKHGAIPDDPFAVIGLGKLGGGELNYSSDVDLLFVFGTEGNTPGLAVSHHEFFVELAERVVRNLTQSTPEGHMYRVDMRLRPEAGAGALARSMQSYLLYYESRGELWERQMLLKARTVAGSHALGTKFLGMLEPFVYPRTFMEHPAESISRIKARIEANIGDAANVKLMPGGIRDIEFTVQALQLVHGGRNPGVRSGNTLSALAALAASSLLGEDEQRSLTEAYIFLRTVEHRLQTMHNRQIHALPSEDQALLMLARRTGLTTGKDLLSTIDTHRRNVRAVFDAVMHVDETRPDLDIGALLDGVLPEASTRLLLERHGFRDVRQALRDLRILSGGSGLMDAPDTEPRMRTGFKRTAGALLVEIGKTPVADLTIHALAMLAAAQPSMTAFHAQLSDPRYRRLLVDIAAQGPRCARALAADPSLLETITGDVGTLVSPAPLSLPAATTLAGLKRQRELLTCLRHLLGFSTFDEMTDALSDLGDFILSQIVNAHAGPPPMAVFAAGKFGSREAGLDADMDLLFIAGSSRSRDQASAERKATRILSALTTVGPEGRLYEVDLRLRPEGRSAPLVADAERYEEYLRKRSSLWERQMLTRLRFVCGDRRLGNRVLGMIQAYVYASPLPSGWVTMIVDMRRKMEPRPRTRGGEIIDLKRGPGGMADIEFLAQIWMLRGHAPVAGSRKTSAILSAATPGLLTPPEHDTCAFAYALYRRLELLLRVVQEERTSILPQDARLDVLARCCGETDGPTLTSHVLRTMREVRKVFLQVTDRVHAGDCQ